MATQTIASDRLLANDRARSPHHIPSLDGFRGCAAFAVVAFHYFGRAGTGPLAPFLSLGWTGVDAFLVLSGYLITGILYKQRGAPHFYRNFYIRRALRLFPLYYFIMLLAWISSLFFAPHWQKAHVAFLFYAANIALSFSQGFGSLGLFNVNHFWTLALEEQFYLIWPWIVGRKLSRQTLLTICLTGIATAFCLRVFLAAHLSSFTLYYNLPFRMDSLLIGAAIALMPLPSKRSAVAVLASCVLVFGVLVYLDHTLFFLAPHIGRYGFTLIGLFYGALLVLTLHPGSLVNRVLSLYPLRFLGKISYGLYLWHYAFGNYIDVIVHRIQTSLHPALLGSVVGFAVPFAVSAFVAYLSFRFLESPFLRLKNRYEAAPPQHDAGSASAKA